MRRTRTPTPELKRRTRSKAHTALDRDAAYQRIYATVDSIPTGRVACYGQVAREAGLPRRARMVGRALRNLDAQSALPWYRVVNGTGRISPRGDGASERSQRRLLESEGVRFDARGRIDLTRFGWQG